jgi:hypothetical protein
LEIVWLSFTLRKSPWVNPFIVLAAVGLPNYFRPFFVLCQIFGETSSNKFRTFDTFARKFGFIWLTSGWALDWIGAAPKFIYNCYFFAESLSFWVYFYFLIISKNCQIIYLVSFCLCLHSKNTLRRGKIIPSFLKLYSDYISSYSWSYLMLLHWYREIDNNNLFFTVKWEKCVTNGTYEMWSQ